MKKLIPLICLLLMPTLVRAETYELTNLACFSKDFGFIAKLEMFLLTLVLIYRIIKKYWGKATSII